MASNKIASELGKYIRDSFEHWHYIYQNGAGDPTWEDGYNLNLVRNHIIYYKKQCEDELMPEQYPPEYYSETPPVVDNKYMARTDEIREHAKCSLKEYEEDTDYQFLKKNLNLLTKKERSEICIDNVLGYVYGLRIAIDEDSLVDMRRHERPATYIDSFRRCRKKLEEIIGTEKVLPFGQLSLFDLYEM